MLTRKAVFRVDASFTIGTGHVMRCLTMADELTEEHMEVFFICRVMEGHMADYINQRGYHVFLIREKDVTSNSFFYNWDAAYTIEFLKQLNTTPDWLIVDHYQIDESWEQIVRPLVRKLFIIDDLANRRHCGDMLLDQNIYDNPEARYRDLVPVHCRLLLGPKYLLLRQPFYEERRALQQREGQLRKLLVFFGGSDPTDETSKVLRALYDLGRLGAKVEVIIGSVNPRITAIKKLCEDLSQTSLHIQIENMAKLVAQADFALGAGGVAMLERCYLGLPSAVTIVADNQLESVSNAATFGAIWNLGWFEQINSKHYADILIKAASEPAELIQMSAKALKLTDSQRWKTHKIISAILEEK